MYSLSKALVFEDEDGVIPLALSLYLFLRLAVLGLYNGRIRVVKSGLQTFKSRQTKTHKGLQASTTCHDNIMNATGPYLVKEAVGELLEADVGSGRSRRLTLTLDGSTELVGQG